MKSTIKKVNKKNIYTRCCYWCFTSCNAAKNCAFNFAKLVSSPALFGLALAQPLLDDAVRRVDFRWRHPICER